jgi:hypothetical protein
LEIEGENQFRVRSYRCAARTIEGLPQSVRSVLAAQQDLSELPVIGTRALQAPRAVDAKPRRLRRSTRYLLPSRTSTGAVLSSRCVNAA